MTRQDKIDLSNVALDLAAKYDWLNCTPFEMGREFEEALEIFERMLKPSIQEAMELAKGTEIVEAIRQVADLDPVDQPVFWRNVHLDMAREIEAES